MALSQLSYDQASLLLMRWYHTMRVEFLNEEELHEELTVRNVTITRDMDLARKRKFLRDRLKLEGEGKHTDILFTPKDPTKDLELCSKRCSELRDLLEREEDDANKRVLQHRLLHYGAYVVRLLTESRGSPNLHTCMQGMVVEMVDELERYFSPPEQVQNDSGTQTPGIEGILVDSNLPVDSNAGDQGRNNVHIELEAQGAPRMLRFSDNEVEWIHRLEARLIGLEQELFNRNAGVEVAVQTDPIGNFLPNLSQNPFPGSQHDYSGFSQHFSQNPFHSTSSYRNFPGVHRSEQQSHPQSGQHPCFAASNLNSPQAPMYQTHTLLPNSNFPNFQQSQNPQYSRPPFQQVQYQVPFQHRHTLPVSKWNIAKYSGDDQGLKLNEFLELVQALSQAERVSNEDLFESAIHLFSGSALKWYMTQRTTGRLINWEHLVFELRRTYMHPDLDAHIKIKIYQRRQQRQESFHEYYFEMEKLFRSMCVQIPDYEKVQILQQNMRIDYKRQITFIPIVNLETLVAAGQKLDALNFSAYNKVFGTEKSVLAIGTHESVGRNQNKATPPPPQQQQRPPGQFREQSGYQNKINSNRPSLPSNPSSSSNSRAAQNYQKPSSGLNSNPTNERKSPAAGPSGNSSRPQLTLEHVVSEHKPPHPNSCFNCGTPGHHVAMCRQPRRLFCDNCGLHGFPTGFCPYCLKNGNRADENRRSQNPQA